MLKRVVAILVGSLVILVVTPRAAYACSWIPPTLEQVPMAPFVFVGTVTDASVPRFYGITVGEVFRGDVPGSLTFGPPEDTPVTSCDAVLEAGATYLFATDELEGLLSLQEVWFAIDGDVADGVWVEGSTSADALYAFLRPLPDTATAVPMDPWSMAGSGLILVALAAAARVRRREVWVVASRGGRRSSGG